MPWFVDIIDNPKLAIETENNSQPITDFENKKTRKELERAAKRKVRHNDFCLSMQTSAARFIALLSSHCGSATS